MGPETFVPSQSVLVQNNLTKLWNIKAKVLSRGSHQGVQTNSYVLKAQKTGRQIIRSERNMRPTAKARVSSSGSDTDIDSDTQASLVLLGNPTSVPSNPISIMKHHTHEGSELSTDSETPALNALSALSSLPRPAASPRHSPPRTRRVKLCSIVSIISEEGIETFEKQELGDLIRSNSDSK